MGATSGELLLMIARIDRAPAHQDDEIGHRHRAETVRHRDGDRAAAAAGSNHRSNLVAVAPQRLCRPASPGRSQHERDATLADIHQEVFS